MCLAALYGFLGRRPYFLPQSAKHAPGVKQLRYPLMETPQTRQTVSPDLLKAENLGELVGYLRNVGQGPVEIDVAALGRIGTPHLQVLAAAVRDGVSVRFTGPTDNFGRVVRLLGMQDLFVLEDEQQ
jgi:hypothetical protein